MAKRTEKIEIGMDLAARCRVTDTWQDDFGDQWVKVLIEGNDVPVTLKAAHFYPFDDHDVRIHCEQSLRKSGSDWQDWFSDFSRRR